MISDLEPGRRAKLVFSFEELHEALYLPRRVRVVEVFVDREAPVVVDSLDASPQPAPANLSVILEGVRLD